MVPGSMTLTDAAIAIASLTALMLVSGILFAVIAQPRHLTHRVGAEAQIGEEDEDGAKGEHRRILTVDFSAQAANDEHRENKRNHLDGHVRRHAEGGITRNDSGKSR
jgi:hypothetical protein